MGKIKSLLIGAAAVSCAFISGTSTSAGEILRNAVYLSAGICYKDIPSIVNYETSNDTSTESSENLSLQSEFLGNSDTSNSTSSEDHESSLDAESSPSESTVEPVSQKRGIVINKNRSNGSDNVDYSQYKNKSGTIYRYNFGYYDEPNIVTMSSGAQIRNCTDDENSSLLSASNILPLFDNFELGSEEPQVLIYHTHTSESFLPYSNSFDPDYPIRSSDCEKNVTAVGDALCEALAARGISVVHDCRVHDYPMFTGAYYRSGDTLLENIEEYPTIKIAIDIHRDGILNDDGSATAPIVEINGKTAAQIMIITGCNSSDTVIPDYMENLKVAALIQNCAEKAYPGLARPILFDYRNYNQSLFQGCILIEVGSQANSLDEVIYTGELLGNVIADSLGNYIRE